MNTTVAVVDDHEQMREHTSSFIEEMGFQLLFKAENGKEALEIMAKNNSVPDVCLLDIQMPVMDGYETAEIMSIQYPKTKILAYSTDDSETPVINMIKSGACGFLLKGGTFGEMKKAIDDVSNSGYYFSNRVVKILFSYFRDKKHK